MRTPLRRFALVVIVVVGGLTVTACDHTGRRIQLPDHGAPAQGLWNRWFIQNGVAQDLEFYYRGDEPQSVQDYTAIEFFLWINNETGHVNVSRGIRFPDGSVQSTATLQGPPGPSGATGPPGPPGPPATSFAVCLSAGASNPTNRTCGCSGGVLVAGPFAGPCRVGSDTNTCNANNWTSSMGTTTYYGACCVCRP